MAVNVLNPRGVQRTPKRTLPSPLARKALQETARINSYTDPGGVLSAADAGTDATITIAAHDRIYPVQNGIEIPPVAIAGGTLTGVTSGVRVWVYYDDETLADTAPTFQWTTDALTAQVGFAPGRHALSYIDTPAAGSGTTSTGSGTGTPGGTGGGGTGGTSLP